MEANRERRKKLANDRVLLLTYRAAAARGLTVEQWDEQTPAREKPYWLALAWIDAWGEEWAEVASMVLNTTRTDATDCKTPSELLRLEKLRKPVTQQLDKASFEALGKALAGL